MDTWQPMGTAPKDGQQMIIWYNCYPVFSGGIAVNGTQMGAAIAIWSTWDHAFRVVGTGVTLNGLDGHQPVYWAPTPKKFPTGTTPAP